jgi:hypothetical protein
MFGCADRASDLPMANCLSSEAQCPGAIAGQAGLHDAPSAFALLLCAAASGVAAQAASHSTTEK